MPTFTQSIADMLRAQFGTDWYYQNAGPQTIRDYVTAPDEQTRNSARLTMERDTINYAVGCVQAAIAAGLVTPTNK